MTFYGFSISERNWKISFFCFQISGDIPSSLFLITETHTLNSSTSLFYFYAPAKKAFFHKMHEHVARSSGKFFFARIF